jgi:hypothetical protein
LDPGHLEHTKLCASSAESVGEVDRNDCPSRLDRKSPLFFA